jgi:hypothetical protein
MSDAKYIVFKKIDMEDVPVDLWDQVRQYIEPIDDAEVIRKQDITSGPVFHLYANLIHAFIDLEFPPTIPTILRQELGEIADHFHNAGLDADEIRAAGKAKLPD